MFSFQKNNDHHHGLVFHDQIPSSSISFQQDDHLKVEIHDHVYNMEGNPVTKARKKHGDQSPSSKPNLATTDQDEHMTQRKLAHREIERQRRQDMAKLYVSLRDLLPLEFVKGKRSTSDHMHQAVNYIKRMEENIRVLSAKRDRLKKLVETTSTGKNTNEKSLRNVSPNNTVSVSSSCNGGIEILINSCSSFPLSRVLEAISEADLYVITCTCTKVNHRLIHSIQTDQANDDPVSSTDNSVLEQRLVAIANNY